MCQQGGRFDHADRLFSSVPAAWSNCLVNTSDVKELTPEFFYLPDFLTNADGFCLGTRQVSILPLSHLTYSPKRMTSPDAATETEPIKTWVACTA